MRLKLECSTNKPLQISLEIVLYLEWLNIFGKLNVLGSVF